MTKTQTILQKIREAVPESMELKMGCEVKFLFGDWYGEIGRVSYECMKCTKHKKCPDFGECFENGNTEEAVSVILGEEEMTEWILLQNGKDFETLGRPLTLNDLLITLATKEKKGEYYEIGSSVNGDKLIVIEYVKSTYDGEGDERVNASYDLSLTLEQNLEENKELVGFLYEIVK